VPAQAKTARAQPYTVTLAEAGTALGLHPEKVRKLVQQGVLDARKLPGHHRGAPQWFTTEEAVDDYLRNGPQEPVTIPPGFHWVVPDLGEAHRKGELEDFGEESVRRFIVRKRAEAIAEWKRRKRPKASTN
jgi:hypothetical protein